MFGMFKKELIEEQPCNDSSVRQKDVMEAKQAGIFLQALVGGVDAFVGNCAALSCFAFP